MFKRVEKKLAKKKEEEELGITEEIKEAIGLNSVDSDDDSSSDESEASSSSSTPQIPSKHKRSFGKGLDGGPDSPVGGHGLGVSRDPGESEDGSGVQMTVGEALRNPLFITSIQPDIRGCIICPGKVLKNDTMVSVHTKSQVSPVPTHTTIFPDSLRGFMTFSLTSGRLISDGRPSLRKWLNLPNKMSTFGRFYPLLLHQPPCLKNCLPMILLQI
jgi:hypothetical protein